MSKFGCAWYVTGLLGIIFVGFGVLGLLDPQSAQLANDADPFGEPPSAGSFVAEIAIGVLFILWPVPILLRRGRGGESSSKGPRERGP